MTKYEEQWLADILKEDYCNQWQLERICRLLNKNAREAVRALFPYLTTRRKYRYLMLDVKSFLGL